MAMVDVYLQVKVHTMSIHVSDNLDKLLRAVMNEARTLAKAERWGCGFQHLLVLAKSIGGNLYIAIYMGALLN